MSPLQHLRQSVVKRLTVCSVLLLGVVSLVLWLMVSRYMHEQMEQALVKRAETTALSVQVAIQTADSGSSIVRLVHALAAGDGITHLIVVKPINGQTLVLAAEEASWVRGRADQQLPADAWAQIQSALTRDRKLTHRDAVARHTFELAWPVLMRTADLRQSVKGVIYVALDTSVITAVTDRRVLTVSASMFGLILGLFGLLYLFLRQHILRPLDDLRQAMLSRQASGHHAQAPIHRPDELGQLAQTYNDLIATITLYENRHQATMDTMVDGLITVDENDLITSFTRSAERIFAYAADEVLGKPLSLLMDRGFEMFTSESACELQAHRKDGSCFDAELSLGQAFDGTKIFYVGLVRDITERKRTAQLKSEFISTVSHELRTPLTSIRGSLGLLSTPLLADSMSPKANKLVNLAHKNCERLVHLINDILDIEKIDSGKLAVHINAQDVSVFLRNALELNQGYGDRYGVRFKLLDQHADTLHVLADPDRLMQVMANLLSNAAKFSPPGGEVHVRASLNNGMVRIEVQDFGEGMPEEFKSRIFQKFAQSDSSTTRKHEGTGLGLNITQKLIEAMCGRIDFKTVLGQGTTFFFDLPLAETAIEA